MSDHGFFFGAARFYIVHGILAAVAPFIFWPLLFLFGPIWVFGTCFALLGVAILWWICRTIYRLCTGYH